MPGLWGRDGDRVLEGTTSDAARMGKGTTVGGGPAFTIAVQGVIYADGGVSGMSG